MQTRSKAKAERAARHARWMDGLPFAPLEVKKLKPVENSGLEKPVAMQVAIMVLDAANPKKRKSEEAAEPPKKKKARVEEDEEEEDEEDEDDLPEKNRPELGWASLAEILESHTAMAVKLMKSEEIASARNVEKSDGKDEKTHAEDAPACGYCEYEVGEVPLECSICLKHLCKGIRSGQSACSPCLLDAIEKGSMEKNAVGQWLDPATKTPLPTCECGSFLAPCHPCEAKALAKEPGHRRLMMGTEKPTSAAEDKLAAEYSIEMTDCERLMLDEISAPMCRPLDVAMSYALALKSSERKSINWPKVNAAIKERWGIGGLAKIKEDAWSGKCFNGESDD